MSILKRIYHLVVCAVQWKCSKCNAKTTTPNDWASCPKGGHHKWVKVD